MNTEYSIFEQKLINRNLNKDNYKNELQQILKNEFQDYSFDEKISEEIEKTKIISKTYYKYFKIYNKDMCYNFIQKLKKNIIIDGKEICEVYDNYKEQYKLGELTQFKKELIIMYYYVYSLLFKIKLSNIIQTYTNDIQFLEKTYIRIKCLKDGWKIESIEKMLNRYYTSDKVTKEDIKLYYFCSEFLLTKLRIIVKKELPKGRPQLSCICKRILNRYTVEKGSNRIKQILKRNKEVSTLFTTDEFEKLKNVIDLSQENEETKNSLKIKLGILLKND